MDTVQFLVEPCEHKAPPSQPGLSLLQKEAALVTCPQMKEQGPDLQPWAQPACGLGHMECTFLVISY